MLRNYDENYDEIIRLFLKFRKIEDGDYAIAFLNAIIKQKIRDYTRGATTFLELKEGDKFIILPLNGFDCCRKDGISWEESGYMLLEKYIDNNAKKGTIMEKARRVSNKIDYSIDLYDLVVKIV